jgi:hypothetical protein
MSPKETATSLATDVEESTWLMSVHSEKQYVSFAGRKDTLLRCARQKDEIMKSFRKPPPRVRELVR